MEQKEIFFVKMYKNKELYKQYQRDVSTLREEGCCKEIMFWFGGEILKHSLKKIKRNGSNRTK